MVDPLLLLEVSSEEEACWVEAREQDRWMAQAFVRRSVLIARGFVLASQQDRGDLAVADIMGSLLVDRGTAEHLLGEALCVAGHPHTAKAIDDGTLSLSAGRALLEVLQQLPPELADRVEQDLLGDPARLEGKPPARVRDLARKVALRLDPQGAAERRKQAAKRRHLGLRDQGDGMVLLTLLVRAEHGLAILHRAERETSHDDGSGRTRDQRRADWVVDTLLSDSAAEPAAAEPAPAGEPAGAAAADGAGPAPAAAGPGPSQSTPGTELVLDGRRRRPVQVLVHVPVTTALGLDDEPCELAEIGPIDAGHGRLLLSTAELRKVCIDARTGQVLHVEDTVTRPVPDPERIQQLGGGAQARAQALSEAVRQAVLDMVHRPSVEPVEPEDGYRPSAALSRTVKTRHPRCTFLTCGTSSRHCDDEHDKPWHHGGETSSRNLYPRSRWCHQAKQRGWRATPTYDGGMTWTSPSGRSYPAPLQHEPPPSLPPDARLHPPTPPPPRDDDGPDGFLPAPDPWPPPVTTRPAAPEPPVRARWPAEDDLPF